MKRLLMTLLLLVLATGEGLAVNRHDISQMSCEQIKTVLRAEGSAILFFPSARVEGLKRYGLYVIDQRACRAPQVAGKRRLRSTTGTCYVYQCADVARSQER